MEWMVVEVILNIKCKSLNIGCNLRHEIDGIILNCVMIVTELR